MSLPLDGNMPTYDESLDGLCWDGSLSLEDWQEP